jgi:ketosteroid isomerase-like protein
MSEEEQIVRRMIDAHNRGGDSMLDDYDELLAQHFEFIPMTVGVMGSPDLATYHGREGMRRYYEERAEAFGSGEVHIRSCEQISEAVVVSARSTARGRGSGVVLEEDITLVYWVRDGKAVRLQAFRSRDEALEAARA